jgi:ABC-type Fe3+-hydroxamate transport system substrate-binding protein/adenosylcobinamide amidohydrolase
VILLKKKNIKIFAFAPLVFLFAFSAIDANAAEITDDSGRRISFASPPERVVSLLPSVTEIICFLGKVDALAGVTYHDTTFEGLPGKKIVGGAFTPRFELINALNPDLLIAAPRDYERARDARGERDCEILVIDDGVSLAEAEDRVAALGKIFGAAEAAEKIIRDNRELLETARLKTEKIPEAKKKKAILLYMGRNGPVTPGTDAFQNEMIRRAGATPPDLGTGASVPVTLEAWKNFNPDFVFTVSSDYADLKKFLEREGWRDVPAARDGRVLSFPSALVCRAAAHVGYFTLWLASEIYADEFASAEEFVRPSGIVSERPLPVEFPYVERARVVESMIRDSLHRTILIDFKRPQRIVSTVSGERVVKTVGNSYSPPYVWSVYHKLGFDVWESDLFGVLKLDPERTDVMVTGADMDNVSIKTAAFKEMKVTAVVTGGVESNALRASKDEGPFYEPGTINVLVMTNHKLSDQAATRAIVTATEAKTAALWDMDIRSAQSRAKYPATGTGTDTVIIVSGEGTSVDWTGGHAKMGELIADTVYRGVQEAILKQNGKTPRREALERLEERGIFVASIMPGRQADLEELLLSPEYGYVRAFLETAFSLSDAQVMGQVSDIAPFADMAVLTARRIAGRYVESVEAIARRDDLPPVLSLALDAIGTGLKYRRRETR